MGRQQTIFNTSAYGTFFPAKHICYVSDSINRVRGIEHNFATGIRIHIPSLLRAVPFQDTTGE